MYKLNGAQNYFKTNHFDLFLLTFFDRIKSKFMNLRILIDESFFLKTKVKCQNNWIFCSPHKTCLENIEKIL